MSLAAARRREPVAQSASCRSRQRSSALQEAGLADEVALADARDPVALAAAVEDRLGSRADITVVCVDVPGCEHGAILATAEGGTVIFFSMATSFSAAALGAEGLAADVTMLVGNGYVPGHAGYAMDLFRAEPGVRTAVREQDGAVTRTLYRNGHVFTESSPGATAMVVDGDTVGWLGGGGRG